MCLSAKPISSNGVTMGGGGGDGDRDRIGFGGAGLRGGIGGGIGVEVQMTGAPLGFRALNILRVNPRMSSALE